MTKVFICITLAVFGAVCAAYLKRKNQEISLVLSMAVVVIIALAALEGVSEIVGVISNITTANKEYIEIPLKVLGVSLLGKIASSICEDAGEKGITSAISITVKTASVIIALPLFTSLLEEIRNVIIL